MKYVNDRIRRQDRLMDEERAIELLREGEYGVLVWYQRIWDMEFP